MFSLDYKVTTSTCNAQGRLKLFSALQMMQDCSELWFTSEPASKEFFEQNGRAQLLAFRQVEAVRMPAFGEDLKVQTSVYDVKPKFGFRNTFIYDAKGEACLKSWSMGAFVSRETGTLSPLPDEICQAINIEPQLPMNYQPRKIILPKSEALAGGEFPVLKDYIDYNRHVNNAQYIRLAHELLPDDFEVSNLRVEFKTPAHLGDVLTSQIYKQDNTIIVVLSTKDAISAIVEFTGTNTN